MAWSRPVVATAVNGCTEVVIDGNTGFLVPVGDITTWARRVLELLNDPALNVQAGKRGRRQVEQSFSLEKTVARTERLYQQISTLF
jgi:glycosyltransferase involved in cell wall biosynthesis